MCENYDCLFEALGSITDIAYLTKTIKNISWIDEVKYKKFNLYTHLNVEYLYSIMMSDNFLNRFVINLHCYFNSNKKESQKFVYTHFELKTIN